MKISNSINRNTKAKNQILINDKLTPTFTNAKQAQNKKQNQLQDFNQITTKSKLYS